jgi:hypothetical protein
VLVTRKRAIRTLSGLGPRDTCTEVFKNLKILSIFSLYILETILYTVKSNQTRMGNIHIYNTRNRPNFLPNTHHLNLFEKKPSYKGVIFYNQLPEDLKRIPDTLEDSLDELAAGPIHIQNP